jgi:pSer/pThr/pTyr-binding forkhead associated (FHA) protein
VSGLTSQVLAPSAHHCSIVRTRGRVYVDDLDSTNGLWVAGCRMRACKLQPGTVFTIGNHSIAAIGPEEIGRDIVIAASTLRGWLKRK